MGDTAYRSAGPYPSSTPKPQRERHDTGGFLQVDSGLADTKVRDVSSVANTNDSPNHLGVNLAFTKFLFVTPRQSDSAAHDRLRKAGGSIARSFFNDFDANGTGNAQTLETIQFLVADRTRESDDELSSAPYVAQVTAKYRPRLREIEDELRRRLGEYASVRALDGAVQVPRYTSAEMHTFAYKAAALRASGRIAPNAIIIPLNKTTEWWKLSTLERHAYFYPHADLATGTRMKGHAVAAEAGIPTIYRRLYHNPDGYQQEEQFDFITYFECADEHLATFDQICHALRDERQNPEWRFVAEGPEWRGRRVRRW